MRYCRSCLLVSLLVSAVFGSEPVYQSPRQIPIVRQVDVVVVGSSLGAVAAAAEAASEGAKVLLVGSRPYLGEDICSTMHLWLDEEDTRQAALTNRIFGDKQTVAPIRVKHILESALLEAGADFLLCCLPTDILVDDDGDPAGIVIADRAGRQAIVAKVVIDATDRAVVARLAGVGMRPWESGQTRCNRVVLGGTLTRGAIPARQIPAGIKLDGRELSYYEYSLDLDMGDGSFAALAEAEQKARDATYRDGQLRSAERLSFVPSDSIIGQATAGETQPEGLPGLGCFRPKGCHRLYVLGASADVPRDRIRAFLGPDVSERIGRMVGEAAGQQARQTAEPVNVSVKAGPAPPAGDADVRDVLRGLRSTDHPTKSLSYGACGVPVLAKVDVAVVGGGTTGACAAIGAARRGADVLVVEYQEGLGGVGTMGLIGHPYHGRQLGFTKEVPFCDKDHNTEYKMEWYRNEIRKAGGKIWFRVLGCGAYVDRGIVKGAVVVTPMGRGVILADVVIDATGNADVAVAAGAESMFGGDGSGIALQGTGLPMRGPGASYVNTDYLLVDESDALDVWRAFVGVRMGGSTTSYDMGTFIQSRERRRVIGDHVLSYLDQIAGRTYPDSIVLSGSDYDSHGYPSEPYFALIPHTAKTLKANHPAPGGTCYTPYRCLLPRGLEGILVTGLGMSMHRDATAMVRMQLDMQNQGYAAGVAAAMAVESRCTPRRIDVKALQRHLVEIGNLPAEVLEQTDSFPLPDRVVNEAVREYGDDAQPRAARCKALAIILSHAQAARPAAKLAFASATGESRLIYARLLGFMGEPEVLPVLTERLEQIDEWDPKIYQGSMAEYAHLPTPVDALILAIGGTRDRRGLPALLKKLETLDASVTLSHHRSLAIALEQIGDPAAAEPLAGLLNKPGMRGHVMKSLEPLTDKPQDKRRRIGPLREIILARALYRCGDWEGLGEKTLNEYRQDIRGLFSRHAVAVLSADD